MKAIIRHVDQTGELPPNAQHDEILAAIREGYITTGVPNAWEPRHRRAFVATERGLTFASTED